MQRAGTPSKPSARSSPRPPHAPRPPADSRPTTRHRLSRRLVGVARVRRARRTPRDVAVADQNADFAGLLAQLASSLNPSVTRGGGAGAGGGLGPRDYENLPYPYSLMNPRLLGLSGKQIDELLGMTSGEFDRFIRRWLAIPSIDEGQPVLPPRERYEIQRLFPVSPPPSQMPLVRPSAAPPAWSWPL